VLPLSRRSSWPVTYSLQAAALQTERIQAVSRSPIYQNFTETLQGATTIRAYGAAERFRELNFSLLNKNSNAVYINQLVFRWAMLRYPCPTRTLCWLLSAKPW
jgi:hypothetical protein